MADAKVVDARNENRVYFKGTEDAARDYIERNFPRHHVDPAAPTLEQPEPDVYYVGPTGGKEMYLGPEEYQAWMPVGGPVKTGDKK